MTVHIEWENAAQTAIRQTFEPQWRWQDYDTSVEKIREMMDSVDHTVHIISDLRATLPQTRGLAWGHFQRALSDIPRNTGMLLVAGHGHFTASLFSLYVQADPKLVRRTHFVSTIAEAHRIMRQYPTPLHTWN